MQWIFENDIYPKFLYATPQFVFSGCGVDSSSSTLVEGVFPQIGFSQFFEDEDENPLWEDFAKKIWIKPRTYRLDGRIFPTLEVLPKSNKREDAPNQSDYEKILNQGFEGIEKIVLARKTTLSFDSTLNISHLLNNHLSVFKTQDVFFFMPKDNVAFMGASPERLYERRGDKIHTAAIAGTMSSEKNPDLFFKSQKELTEHQFVVDDLKQKLSKVCSELKYDLHPSILTSHHLLHLKTSFAGTLKEKVTDHDLISLIHPTTAVLGHPRENVLKTLKKIEHFNRGLYAAPFGLMMEGSTYVCVAIRSILTKNNQVYAFAGSGLVEGSTAEHEWNELNHKISPYLW